MLSSHRCRRLFHHWITDNYHKTLHSNPASDILLETELLMAPSANLQSQFAWQLLARSLRSTTLPDAVNNAYLPLISSRVRSAAQQRESEQDAFMWLLWDAANKCVKCQVSPERPPLRPLLAIPMKFSGKILPLVDWEIIQRREDFAKGKLLQRSNTSTP